MPEFISRPDSSWSRRNLLHVIGAGASTLMAEIVEGQPAFAAPPSADEGSLKGAGAKSGILFGLCEPGSRFAQERIYFEKIAGECNLFSPGNDFNWATLQKDQAQLRYAQLDGVAAFCRDSRLGMLGHTLAWYYAVPAWAKVLDPSEFAPAFRTYVEKTVERFADIVSRWDVVNEAVHPRSNREDGLRESAFLEKLGPTYIQEAFSIARQAAPQGLLCINEYGVEYDEPAQARKRASFLELLRSLRRANAPVNVVGLQSHLDASKTFDIPGLTVMLREIKDLGFQIAITELDVNDQMLPGDILVRDNLCAQHVDGYLACVFSEMRPISITTWGFTDSHSWLNNLFNRSDGMPLRPLAFDDQFSRKPLWHIIKKYLVTT